MYPTHSLYPFIHVSTSQSGWTPSGSEVSGDEEEGHDGSTEARGSHLRYVLSHSLLSRRKKLFLKPHDPCEPIPHDAQCIALKDSVLLCPTAKALKLEAALCLIRSDKCTA